ncbi:HAD-IA family hydrolase [Streptomyces sp. TRM66268-LWL]|uniref:HAD-IA family hydrolase n=2 Tax=Streptomyces polyasparticus TaxID=2767826 RepID=A0ABR7STL7_9ACTN|nr:HAD-IA family hydrolase [Streptomyces polyasparticus]
MRPVGGRWNPRADFEPTVLAHSPGITGGRFAEAVAAGDRFLGSAADTPSRDAYHRFLLGRLGVEPAAELLAELVREVDPCTVLELYPDVLGTLDELRRRGVRMAVVSDAWPELPALHDRLGMAGYFEAYAISAVLGCTKPDPRMYRHASDALGLEPAQCLFVDDDPELVAAALALGYEGRAMLRPEAPWGPAAPAGVASVGSLTELLELL